MAIMRFQATVRSGKRSCCPRTVKLIPIHNKHNNQTKNLSYTWNMLKENWA